MILPTIYPETLSLIDWLSNRFIAVDFSEIRGYLSIKNLITEIAHARNKFIIMEKIAMHNKMQGTHFTLDSLNAELTWEGNSRYFYSPLNDPLIYTDNKEGLVNYICDRKGFNTNKHLDPANTFRWKHFDPFQRDEDLFGNFLWCIVYYPGSEGENLGWIEVYKSPIMSKRISLVPERQDREFCYGIECHDKTMSFLDKIEYKKAYTVPAEIESAVVFDMDPQWGRYLDN